MAFVCRPSLLKRVIVGGGLLLLVGAGGCGSLAGGPGQNTAQLRFVEVSPGSPEMDFYVNGAGAAYGIGYESFTSYLPVSPGTADLAIHRAGMGQVLATAQEKLLGGRQYTAIVSRGPGSLQERVYPDQESPAPSGQMSLRVIDMVEGAGPLTVYVAPAGGETSALVLTAASGTALPYTLVRAGATYVVTATLGEHGLNLPVASVTVKADSGAVRTVVFAGWAKGAGGQGAVGFALTDSDPI